VTTLPIKTILDRPDVLFGQLNGQLPDRILYVAPRFNGGPDIRLVQPSMRKFLALAGTAKQAGFLLKATSYNDSYRPLAVQQQIHDQRYQRTPISGVTAQMCDDGAWYLKPGYATAACPGHSNHGWAQAIDLANAFGALLDWLIANVVRFGFSFELQSESWHIRDFTGDTYPDAVLTWEAQHMTDPIVKADLEYVDYAEANRPARRAAQGGKSAMTMLTDLFGQVLLGGSVYDKAEGWLVRQVKTIVAKVDLLPGAVAQIQTTLTQVQDAVGKLAGTGTSFTQADIDALAAALAPLVQKQLQAMRWEVQADTDPAPVP
jgi:hypothetical protein